MECLKHCARAPLVATGRATFPAECQISVHLGSLEGARPHSTVLTCNAGALQIPSTAHMHHLKSSAMQPLARCASSFSHCQTAPPSCSTQRWTWRQPKLATAIPVHQDRRPSCRRQRARPAVSQQLSRSGSVQPLQAASVAHTIPEALEEEAPPRGVRSVVLLDVREMMCGGCSAAVRQRLLDQPGVEAAAVNLVTETAAVTLSPDAALTGEGSGLCKANCRLWPVLAQDASWPRLWQRKGPAMVPAGPCHTCDCCPWR